MWTANWTEDDLQAWVEAIKRGEVVGAPAEGMYGYCCDPLNPKALQKLCELKQRTPEKGFIVLLPYRDQLLHFTRNLRMLHVSAMDMYWHKGGYPTSLVLPARETLPRLLTGNFDTIALRYPQHPAIRAYLRAYGQPLVSTSMNLAGEEPILDDNDVPEGIVCLKANKPLSGDASAIYDPLGRIWKR